jgi:hypothetical protein
VTVADRYSPTKTTNARRPGEKRTLNAEDAFKATHAEILTQRTRIGELLGQIRDLQTEWTEETIQRITTENTPSNNGSAN